MFPRFFRSFLCSVLFYCFCSFLFPFLLLFSFIGAFFLLRQPQCGEEEVTSSNCIQTKATREEGERERKRLSEFNIRSYFFLDCSAGDRATNESGNNFDFDEHLLRARDPFVTSNTTEFVIAPFTMHYLIRLIYL